MDKTDLLPEIKPIPILDRDKKENFKSFSTPQFHQFIVDSWENLGRPKLFKIDIDSIGMITFVADPHLGNEITKQTGAVRENVDEDPEPGKFEKSKWTLGLGGDFGPVGPFGIFAMSNVDDYEGITYHEIQQYIARSFNKESLKRYGTIMVEDAVNFAESLAIGNKVDLAARMNQLTLDSTTRSLMSLRFDDEEQVKKLTTFLRDGPNLSTMKVLVKPIEYTIAQLLATANILKNVPRESDYRREKAWLYTDIVRGIMNEKLNLIDNNPNYVAQDMLDFLILGMRQAQSEEREANKGVNKKFTEERVKRIIESQIATFLVAGQGTVTSQEISVDAYIFGNPDVYTKIKEELKKVLGNRLPTFEDFENSKLPYLEAVISYVLAKYPSVFIIPREATEDINFEGYQFKKGEQIFPAPLLVHKLLFPNIDQEGPEMFLKEENKKILMHEALAFGKGRRVCLGMRFAIMEMMLHVATLLHTVDFELIEKTGEESGLIPLRAAGKLIVRVNENRAEKFKAQEG